MYAGPGGHRDRYNQIFTMHGSTMMFLFAVPVMEAMGLYLVPLMIGTRNTAFPRLSNYSYFTYLTGGILLYVAFFLDFGPDVGWFSYVPLAGPEFSPGKRADVWCAQTKSGMRSSDMVSPLDPLSDVLFSAHMAQHEVLTLVSAPLLVLGRALLAFFWAFDNRERIGRRLQSPRVLSAWHAITGPLVVWVLHALALWIWHVPSLYEAALRDEAIHAVQHLSFFVTASLFWWALVHGRFGRIGYGMAVFYVFTTAVHSSILGALLTVAPRLWYPLYEARTARWSLDPLQDQQLAGLLMWVPAGVIFLVLGLALFAAWLGEAERRVAHTRSETLARRHG